MIYSMFLNQAILVSLGNGHRLHGGVAFAAATPWVSAHASFGLGLKLSDLLRGPRLVLAWVVDRVAMAKFKFRALLSLTRTGSGPQSRLQDHHKFGFILFLRQALS